MELKGHQNEYKNQIIEVELRGEKVLAKEYTVEDREKLLALFDQLEVTPQGSATLRSRFGHYISKKEFEVYLDDPLHKYRAVVMTTEEVILGWGEYFVDPNDFQRAELSRLVLPGEQGKGVGTFLAGHLIDRCQRSDPDVTRMESLIDSGNTAAIRSLLNAAKQYRSYRVDDPKIDISTFTFILKE